MERISPIHLKEIICGLIDGSESKEKAIEVMQRYINTVRSDKKEMVSCLEQLTTANDCLIDNSGSCKSHSNKDGYSVCGTRNAKRLIEQFGEMPKISLSSNNDQSTSKLAVDKNTGLAPCPFCSGEAEVKRMGTSKVSMIIECTECGCDLETGETWIDKNTQWNKRSN